MKRKICVFVPILLVFVVIFTVLTPTVAMSENIANKVFRLHILANSDNDYDQELKLKVRDSVLENTGELFKSCASLEAAIQVAEDNISYIESVAQSTVAYYGYDYDAEVEVTRDYFSTREYDGFTLPAGVYNCIRISIGEARGHNWWCVMYPAVCLNDCSELLENELDENEYELVTSNGKIVKFRFVELYENIKSKFIS